MLPIDNTTKQLAKLNSKSLVYGTTWDVASGFISTIVIIIVYLKVTISWRIWINMLLINLCDTYVVIFLVNVG